MSREYQPITAALPKIETIPGPHNPPLQCAKTEISV